MSYTASSPQNALQMHSLHYTTQSFPFSGDTAVASSPEDIEGYACLIHPVREGLVDAYFASCLQTVLDERLLESCAGYDLCAAILNCSAFVAFWQSVEEGLDFVQDFSLIVGLKEGARLHTTTLAYQVVVNSSNITTVVVLAFLAVYALADPD